MNTSGRLLAPWLAGCAMVALFAAHAREAVAWTHPISISETNSTNSHVARGANGGLHTSWYSDWRIKYRYRHPAGNWGPIETLSTFFSHRNDVIEDASGAPHVFYCGEGASGKSDIYHCRKVDGSWQIVNLTNSGSHDEDQPRAGLDSLGRIHLVYTKSSGGNSIMYRMWQNGSWTGETTVSSGGDSYYHRPDISVAPNNSIHVIHATGGELKYVRHNGTSWSGPVNIATGGDFFSYPRIAAVSNTQLIVVTHDQNPGGLRWTISNDGGANWAARQYLVEGHWPNMDAFNGNAHLAFTWGGSAVAGYMCWTGSGWTGVQAVAPPTNWQGWADVAADVSAAHVVYDDSREDGTRISFVSSLADTIPPLPVSGFTAIAGHWKVTLSWTNPPDLDFAGTMIRYGTSGYPAGPADGTWLANRPAAAGSSDGMVHEGAVNGTAYYYSAFAYDTIPNYAAGATAWARPFVPPDHDRDTDVDQEDFGFLQACLSGAFTQPPAGCQSADYDRDGDVDVDDVDRFAACLSGAGVPAAPDCLE